MKHSKKLKLTIEHQNLRNKKDQHDQGK